MMKGQIEPTCTRLLAGSIIGLLVSCSVLSAVCVTAGAATGWSTTYGGKKDDFATDIVQTSDGGYAISGTTESFGAGSSDYWLIRTDPVGNIIWNKTYGGTGPEELTAMCQTNGGGYALAGRITISIGDPFYNTADVWLVKTDASGNMQWNQTYGGTGDDLCNSVVQARDGGYALAGVTMPFGGGRSDFWLVKTDGSGNVLWNKTYGGTGNAWSYSMIETGDGGFALAGCTDSFGAGDLDGWVVKTDAYGNIVWNKTYGGTGTDGVDQLIRTVEGGYAMVGTTPSSGLPQSEWLVKTDASGNMEWNRTYEGMGTNYWASLIQTGDGGFALAGVTGSFGAGMDDVWLVKTDAYGTMQWNKTYGGTKNDVCFSVILTKDGGYALAGYTYSFGAGGYDFYVVRTDAVGVVPEFSSWLVPAFTLAAVTYFLAKNKRLFRKR